MSKIKLKEFEDDAAAETAVAGVTSSLTKLASAVTNVKDFSRVVEAIAKWLIRTKGSQLSSLESNQNYIQAMKYLNKIQSDLDDKDKKPVEKPVVQKQ